MLPRFEITARHRPIALVGTPAPVAPGEPLALVAPFAAVEVGLAGARGRSRLSLSGPDGTRLGVELTDGKVALSVATTDGASRYASRRHGRSRDASRLALTLTGTHLAALAREPGGWVVRGRVDLAGPGLPAAPPVQDPDWLRGVAASYDGEGSDVAAGAFGQLGLRDIRLVTHADGTPYRRGDGTILFTATSAGPGFFGTAHTSVWALDRDDVPHHRADLWFERPGGTAVYGDHATHLLRDGDRWLVATSTWADFPTDRRERDAARVRVHLAETDADLTRGSHVLATRALRLPTQGPSVGVWDPHLVRTGEGWLVGYVSARRFFDFHPVLAAGPTLDELTLRGAATDRTATEGTTLVRMGEHWRVLASDGRDNPRRTRGRFPLFDDALREIGTLDAPYPTNIPWPSVVPPDPDVPGDEWRLVTFDGTPSGGALAGYGTHGDLVVMRAVGPGSMP